jgi:DNA ligase-1
MINYQSPVLYHRGRKGVIYQWRVWAEDATIFTEYGQVDGQLQTTPGKTAEAKNVGRSNETTPEQQAVLEAQAMYTFKIERKYCATVEECQQRKLLPMLAPGKEFSETKKWVTYPCDVQPKLDGCRCLAYWDGDSIVLGSRSGKPWNLPHIVEQLRKVLPEDASIDGELFVPEISFQQITKLIKSKFAMERESVQYHVYDLPISGEEGLTWLDRKMALRALFSVNALSSIVPVRTITAESEDDIIRLQSEFVRDGYEGAMVRLLDGIYEWGYRSKSLLKVKTFDDHEYRIVGFDNGRGKNETTVTWTCELPDGRRFNVAPIGKREHREQMLASAESYVGMLLKVKHFGYTDAGFPRFPGGIGVRPEEDTPAVAA